MTTLLSFAGGGVFGIGPAAFIAKLEGFLGYSTRGPHVQAYAGTSVGAMNAALLAFGRTGKELLGLYDSHLEGIFGDTSTAYTLFKCGAKYSDVYVTDLLKRLLPFTLGHAPFPLFIPAWNRRTRDLKVFCSLDPKDKGIPVWEAVRASMAAPTYFAPFGPYMDGGMACNNPALAGAAGLLSYGHPSVRVLDLETSGYTKSTLPNPSPNAFVGTTLAEDIIPALTKGNSSHVAYMAKAFLCAANYRKEAPLLADHALDAVDYATDIKAIWERHFAQVHKELIAWL